MTEIKEAVERYIKQPRKLNQSLLGIGLIFLYIGINLIHSSEIIIFEDDFRKPFIYAFYTGLIMVAGKDLVRFMNDEVIRHRKGLLSVQVKGMSEVSLEEKDSILKPKPK